MKSMRSWCRSTLPRRRSRGATSPQTCSSPSPGLGRQRAASLPRGSRTSFVWHMTSSSRNKKISTFTCRRMKMWNLSFVTFVRKPSSFQTSWGCTRSSTIPKTNLWLAIFVSVILNSLMLFKSTDKYTLLSSYLYCFIEFVYWDWEGLASIHFLMQLSVTLSGRSQGMGMGTQLTIRSITGSPQEGCCWLRSSKTHTVHSQLPKQPAR